MKAINVMVLHGIGRQGPGYARDLIRGLKREFKKQVESILKVDFRWEIDRSLKISEFLWADIVRKEQEKLSRILKKDIGGIKISFSLFNIISQILFRGLLRLRANFAAESAADIIAYGHKNQNVYRHIQSRLLDTIGNIEGGDGKKEISFIAHSLGSVIASDFIYDKQHGILPDKFRLLNFFTLGCPIALYALKYGDPENTFNQPVRMEEDFGRWVNILDRDDPIGFNLKPLNKAYNEAVLKDAAVNTGFFGISHLKYWRNGSVHKIIARKLALDWLRKNGLVEEPVLGKLYEQYDK